MLNNLICPVNYVEIAVITFDVRIFVVQPNGHGTGYRCGDDILQEHGIENSAIEKILSSLQEVAIVTLNTQKPAKASINRRYVEVKVRSCPKSLSRAENVVEMFEKQTAPSMPDVLRPRCQVRSAISICEPGVFQQTIDLHVGSRREVVIVVIKKDVRWKAVAHEVRVYGTKTSKFKNKSNLFQQNFEMVLLPDISLPSRKRIHKLTVSTVL